MFDLAFGPSCIIDHIIFVDIFLLMYSILQCTGRTRTEVHTLVPGWSRSFYSYTPEYKSQTPSPLFE